MEIFLKRAERPFKEKIGEKKTYIIFQDLKKALYLIPSEFSGAVGLEIPKYLFKCSQVLENFPANVIEGILHHFLLFTKLLTDLSNHYLKQVNQALITRSNSEIRNLSDLLKNFVDKAKKGNLLKEAENFDEIITFIIGKSKEIAQFDELEIFIKRSADNFAKKIGNDSATQFIKDFSEALKNIVVEIKSTVDSDIVKYMFKYSQDIRRLSPKDINKILIHTIIFTKALSDFGGMNKSQIDQEIIRRSKNQMRGLFDLFKTFLDIAKEGKMLESVRNIEDIISHVLGSKKEHLKFTDVGGFLKRVEKKYALYLGEIKAKMLIDDILKALSEIPEEHRDYLGSDISRFLTKYSETMNKLEIKDIERTLTRSLMFTRSLKELKDLNREEINQFIINRSKHEFRNLFDLYRAFLQKESPLLIKSKTPSFDDIIIYILGKYEGPKAIEEAPHIHELMADYHKDFYIAEEHAKWANALNIILPRYLEILKNEEGDRIFDQFWENSFPKQKIIEEFRQKIDDLPRDDEKKFTLRLMNLLTRQIIKKKHLDKLLMGSVAMIILGKIYIEIYSGRNSMIRAIKLKKLLKERQYAQNNKKEKIDNQIEAIVKEDLNAIMRRVLSIRSIIPILTLKGYYIKTFDISKKEYPELFVDMFEDVSPLNDIGKEYLENIRRLNTLGNLSALYYYIDLVRNFNKNYFKESEETPLDAMKNRDLLKDFFRMLFDVYDNLELTKFFENKITVADRLVFIYILKYLYEPLQEFFKLIEDFLEEHKEFIKVKSMEFFLSNLKRREYKMNIEQIQEDVKNAVSEGFSDDSEKMKRLKNMLEQQKFEFLKFRLMDDLVKEAKKSMPILDARILFGKNLFTFLDIVKHINPNLPAVLPSYFENFEDFKNEFDIVLNKVKKLKEQNLISSAEFYEIEKAREVSTERILKLIYDENFVNHINKMREGYDKNILYREEIKPTIKVEKSDEIIEEINPLEKYFKNYNEALTAVKSTNTLTKFMETYDFWTNNQILPVTYNKAEEVLLKIVFKIIHKEMDNIT
ncbi:MAG: hypothetical protein ACFFAN_06385 [Promethearchaeota archaeon]